MTSENIRAPSLPKRRPTTVIDGALWYRFVQMAAKRFGYRKGVIQQALEEAMTQWLEKEPEVQRREGGC